MPMTAIGTIETGVVLTLLVTIGAAVGKYGYDSITEDIDELDRRKADSDIESDIKAIRDDVESLYDMHRETRRLAEAAYATVHGDEDRPEDTGFIIESKERWDSLESDISGLSQSVARLQAAQERHQRKMEATLDAMVDELDLDIVIGDGGSR